MPDGTQQSQALATLLTEASARLASQLAALPPGAVRLSDMGRHYLRCFLGAPEMMLDRYRRILERALLLARRPPAALRLADYGGGLGVLSLLARRAGIGQVVYCDISADTCEDAQRLARALDLEAGHYVKGDVTALADFGRATGTGFDVLVSADVLEHIYDLEDFFSKLPLLGREGLAVVMITSANHHNPWIRRQLMRGHRQTEYKDLPKKWEQGKRDTLHSYFSLRCRIVSERAPQLPEDQVRRLAKATRGLVKPAIEKCVDEYLRTGNVSRSPDHPTNTCCPYTGYWAERLVKTAYYRQLLAVNGFAAKITAGRWTATGGPARRAVKGVLNFLIRRLAGRPLCLAPYLLIEATLEKARKC
jgi:SAM-dependent methyltransferase